MSADADVTFAEGWDCRRKRLNHNVELMSCPVLVVRSRMTQVSHRQWGEVSGRGAVDLWVLQSPQVRVEVLTLGAIIRSVYSRDKDGQIEDIVLGYDDLEGRKEKNLTLTCF